MAGREDVILFSSSLRFIRLCFSFEMPRGFHAGSLRVPCGFLAGSLRVPCGFLAGSLRVPARGGSVYVAPHSVG